jgi:hypothetical protein
MFMNSAGLMPEKTALAMPSKNRKLQTPLLVREGAPRQQTRNCLKIIRKQGEKFVAGPRWVPDTKTDRPTDPRSYYNVGFDFNFDSSFWIRLHLLARAPVEERLCYWIGLQITERINGLMEMTTGVELLLRSL